ncbi:UDP-N-acetylmuramate dehydrogenase [Streptosporangium album]|uniref:UDP-N-acetylenolpyruvoylglucosamine reductase n=1 Tax=Streptosporangium album TaxID=47479 RepID=A0A7W7RZ31_9ACTN|nr:UDP-N-acetylmuramate dehydrogenase [Streptosporangium album]MBB4940775.1 UDP-N-acetylmuramate dehydrogenase [Streptosporangium album]
MSDLLADHTTLRLGGPADRLLTHTDPAAWTDLTQTVIGQPVAPFVLGGGSNTLAADAGYPGPVIHMTTRGITVRPLGDGTTEVTVQAGEPLSALVGFAVSEGLSGIEYLAGIPGTTGAAPVQNTGAYGQQISDALTHLTVYDWNRRQSARLRPEECGFGYRTSIFKTHLGRWTILEVALRLTPSTYAAPVTYQYLAHALDIPLGTRPPLAEAAQGVLADRCQRGLALPENGPDARQAGSVFLNPPITTAQADAVRAAGGVAYRDDHSVLRASAGWLLQLAGHHPGNQLAPGVFCSTRRALTLTAHDGATAASFNMVLQKLARDVYEVIGIRLHPEPVRPVAAWMAAEKEDPGVLAIGVERVEQ